MGQMKNENRSENQPDNKDSLGFAMGKSPWFLYALAQIPILIILGVIAYFIYQNRTGQN